MKCAALVLLVLLAAMACRQQRAPLPDPTPERAAASKLTPARDPEGAVCADVGTLRACWSVSHLGTILVVSRTVPEGASRSPMGWRCWGQGAERACVDRRASAPAFECEGSSCVQRHPRMPDDGEWVCADSAGTTVCRGGTHAAGVAAAPADPGWFCGQRRGSPAGEGSRVCVDLAPDFPDGVMSGWRCRMIHDAPVRRVCERDPQAPNLAKACDEQRPCVDGARCAWGRCIPGRPSPDCWLDGDCPGRRCRFGSCVEAQP